MASRPVTAEDLYDDSFIERREKRLRDLSMLRQVSILSAITALALTAASVVGISHGDRKEFVIVTMTLVLWLVAIVTFFLQRAQSNAERTIESEYEEGRASVIEKPKRKTAVRLTDDGEISDDEPSLETDTNNAIRQSSRK